MVVVALIFRRTKWKKAELEIHKTIKLCSEPLESPFKTDPYDSEDTMTETLANNTASGLKEKISADAQLEDPDDWITPTI